MGGRPGPAALATPCSVNLFVEPLPGLAYKPAMNIPPITSALDGAAVQSPRPHAISEILRVFLKLGLTSFGGPVAHLGYFRTEFVARRQWLSEAAYADIVALCQFLPGPASSQVAVSIGILRSGLAGGLAAWRPGADSRCRPLLL